ncbi:MAG: hypothetical protein ROY82_08740 [Truepera sp.]|nr:hypothetical protein [Truepera sp.]
MITPGSANVFADLGLKDLEERLEEARLASRTLDGLEARGWAPGQAVEALSSSEVEAARLVAGRLKTFSVADLTGLLALVERGA